MGFLDGQIPKDLQEGENLHAILANFEAILSDDPTPTLTLEFQKAKQEIEQVFGETIGLLEKRRAAMLQELEIAFSLQKQHVASQESNIKSVISAGQQALGAALTVYKIAPPMAATMLKAFVETSANVVVPVPQLVVDLKALLSLKDAIPTMGTVRLSQDQPGVNRPKERINGMVTFSGDGTKGHLDDKLLLKAKYSSPCGMVMDVKRNRFLVADAGNGVIRSIDSQGVTTFVGSKGKSGFQNGKQTNASLSSPSGIVYFNKGDVFFVTNNGNHQILKITPDGDVSLYAGTGENVCRDGTTANASFCYPFGIAIDQRNGTVYVSSVNGSCIQKITPQGNVTTCAGQSENPGDKDGETGHSRLRCPYGICFSERLESLFIADYGNHNIRKLDVKSGELSTVAGGKDRGFRDGEGKNAVFNSPTGIALAEDGSLLVADNGNHIIRRIQQRGDQYNVETLRSGKQGHVDGDLLTCQLSSPWNVYVDNGTCYVADQGSNTIRKFSL